MQLSINDQYKHWSSCPVSEILGIAGFLLQTASHDPIPIPGAIWGRSHWAKNEIIDVGAAETKD